jgi:type IV pilus assembly protein PilN
MKVTTNLATRRYVNLRQLNAGIMAAFLILGGLLVYNVREAALNQAELTRVRELTAAALKSRPGAARVEPGKQKALEERIAFANSLIARKTVNWIGILDRLEEVVPAGVALTVVEPSLKDDTVKVGGVAQSFDNLRALMENMEQSPSFSEVYLLQSGEVKVGQTQKGTSFSITCKVSYQ